jgi:hypothetical protein
MAEELVIFTRTFDLLAWILPRAADFPRPYRDTVARRLQDAALDFQESLFEASAESGKTRLSHLRRADANLNKVRLYLRLAYQWHWLNSGQYEHVSRMVAEVGRLLGGWLKQAQD